jgi:enoyl-CoA hydratase/carnithine racemase
MLQSGPEFTAWLAARPPPRPASLGEAAVLVEREGAALCVTLNRPAVRNAFNTAMRDGLVGAFQVALADPSIEEVHLRGAGPSFCSGGDLSEFGSFPDPVVAHLVRSTRSPAATLAAGAARTTAHVHGASVGAGIELAAIARRVLAADDAYFLLPEVGMGLVPGAGGTASIPRRIGRQRTAFMALSGARVELATALEWGLVDGVGG